MDRPVAAAEPTTAAYCSKITFATGSATMYLQIGNASYQTSPVKAVPRQNKRIYYDGVKGDTMRFGLLGEILGLSALLTAANSAGLPAAGFNKVAYYAFDATPDGQSVLPLTTFAVNANIVVVFEGTLWELADSVHYNTGAMRNKAYSSKKQILDDIRTLRNKGVFVLMNVDDAPSWSTPTPFTTWNKKTLDYRQFAAFVDSCVTVAGFDGISLDVEHKAVDNADYRNLIREFGKYFGPLSSSSSSKIFTGAFYTSQFTAPGAIFREAALARYLNFVMDMGYAHDNAERFNYWAATLGNAKVMDGMSHQYNSLSSAVEWAAWHPLPDKAGVMVFAANVNKHYTDTIFAALGFPLRSSFSPAANLRHRSDPIDFSMRTVVCRFSLTVAGNVTLKLFTATGKACGIIFKDRFRAGSHTVKRQWENTAPGVYNAVLEVDGETLGTYRLVVR